MDALLSTQDPRGVAWITLNRPQQHNALNRELVQTFTRELRRLGERPDARAIVLSAAGESFCAGADIQEMRSLADASFDDNEATALDFAELVYTLDTLPKPTVTLVNGSAYGGGVGLVACCDVAIATPRARFCMSEVKLGIIPAIISPFVIRAIGLRQARRFILTAEQITAAQAFDIGLVHAVAAEAEISLALESVLGLVLQGAPAAQAEAKAFLAHCSQRQIDEHLMRDAAHRLATVRTSPQGREGLSAFLEKRAPSWGPQSRADDV
jgi:methylglutaconyl-CoA hydratase